jgi:tRNA (guanine6-N2)-methyltransferase
VGAANSSRSGGDGGRGRQRGAAPPPQRRRGNEGAQRTRPRAEPVRRQRGPSGHRVEFVFLPGLEDVVRDEVRAVLGTQKVEAVPGREDAVQAVVGGSLRPTLRLRTVVAPFLLLRFEVPRPKSLLDGEHFPRLLDGLRLAAALDPRSPSRSFRFDAAGRDTPAFRLLADQLAAASKMRHDPEDGATLIRFRRTPDREGWEVLVRLGPRPLSARPWRRTGYVAAANATVAAAMAQLTRPRAEDRVANLMVGSGTLLIERLLAAPAKVAVGVDSSPEAVRASTENVDEAGLRDRVELFEADVTDDAWARRGPFDVLLADPPWSDKLGRHEDSEELHMLLLRRAHEVSAPRARFAVLTHEIRVMARCLERVRDLWVLDVEQKVFHKGHHPRIYLLRRAP